MKRFLGFFGAVALLLSLPGCLTVDGRGLNGGLYTGVQYATNATAQTSVKKGESCAMSILGLVAVGDASIDTARRNGGIRSISSVDDKVTTFLFGLYSQVCTIVRGK